ncbi:hypothetical protein C8R44DRAFT_798402, partial [Mycena epipterygia]
MLFLYGYVSFSLMLPLLMCLYVPHASILCWFADMSGHHCTTRHPAKSFPLLCALNAKPALIMHHMSSCAGMHTYPSHSHCTDSS